MMTFVVFNASHRAVPDPPEQADLHSPSRLIVYAHSGATMIVCAFQTGGAA
ncbi:hypothetical protein EC845_3452 [Comamonas sp. BIGb0124]|uniref:hypothetical protein n=1 Tax=Comamonas sp. BIGb0124 TaxID=2485130 RepID=UPI000FAAAF01|nr:hypothetical protein [Comamonas sp. BIGb0124]ROR18479.1 hypothetical protein EC845_3452 [Comamonas sp. BIGb0124]